MGISMKEKVLTIKYVGGRWILEGDTFLFAKFLDRENLLSVFREELARENKNKEVIGTIEIHTGSIAVGKDGPIISPGQVIKKSLTKDHA